jgi:Flp pilus assembly protein TadD
MSKFTILAPILLAGALALGGCAAGPGPDPSTQGSLGNERQRADELLAKGQQAAARGDAVRAEQYLGLAIEQGADRRRVMPIMLRACLASSHLRAALNYTEPYLREYPDDDALRYVVATIHVGLGQEAAARRELRLLLARKASNPEAHYLLGVLDAARGVGNAREHFRAALEYSKDDGQKIEIRSRLAELSLGDGESELGGGNSDVGGYGATLDVNTEEGQ